MNFFSQDVINGMVNVMNSYNGFNKGNGSNDKQNLLKSNLQRCTYPDEVKYLIQKSVRQVFNVYPFFNPDLLQFAQHGVQRRYLQLKGILEIQIKAKTCKVDFNMMLPFDFPRVAPFVRIINRNADYKIDPFYKALQSKTDQSSFVLNQKLNSVKTWHPSNSLVNIIIECYELLKNRFPFSKPVSENNSYGGNSGNAWDNLYKKQENNFGGGGFVNNNNNWNNNNQQGGWNNQNNNNSWGNNQSWGNQPQQPNSNWVNNWGNNNNQWGPNNPSTNNNAWGGNANNNNAWGANNMNNYWAGGMGGVNNAGNNSSFNAIAAAQKLVGNQKQLLTRLSGQQAKLISKSQQLDIFTKSLESQSNYLRVQNFQMTNFLKNTEQSSEIVSLTSIIQPKDQLSSQILELTCSIKARQQCSSFLESKFNQQKISLQQFLKHLRKIQQTKFQQKFILQKCLKNRA